jgi:hypothetical protein
MEVNGMSRHRLEFTASPTRAKLMDISFVKLSPKRERKPLIFAACVVLTSVP